MTLSDYLLDFHFVGASNLKTAVYWCESFCHSFSSRMEKNGKKTQLITILYSLDAHGRNVKEFSLGAIMTEEMIRVYVESDKPLS